MTVDELVAQFQATLPYPPDPFQVDAVRALAQGRSVLVAAPTGTGKTVIGEFGIFLARQHQARAFCTTPIKALSNQKFREFRARFGDDQVGLLTGDVVVNPQAPVTVMTTEVLRNTLVTGRRFSPLKPAEGQLGLGRTTEVLRNSLVSRGRLHHLEPLARSAHPIGVQDTGTAIE